MTNLIKQSLEDNKDFILENLPKEFHTDFEASIDKAIPSEKLSKEQAVEQAERCMRENPNVLAETRREVLPQIQADNNLGKPIPQPSEAELEKQKEQAIVEINANLS